MEGDKRDWFLKMGLEEGREHSRDQSLVSLIPISSKTIERGALADK